MFLTDGYPDGINVEHDSSATVMTSREAMIKL